MGTILDSPRAPKIRRARLSDVPELMEMIAALNRSEGIVWRRRRLLPALRRLLRDPRLGQVVVLEQGDRQPLCGYAVVTFGYDLEYAGHDAFLTELFVRPRYRGRGAGRRLLEAASARARIAGAAAIHLGVLPANRAARRLYQRAGFAPIPRLFLSRRLPRRRPGRAPAP